MSARLRSTPWWEQCEPFGHDLKLEGPVSAADPDGVFFARCSYCTRAAHRRRRLAQVQIVIVLDWGLRLDLLFLPVMPELPPDLFDYIRSVNRVVE